MSVNQHNAPPGAKPYLFVTVDDKAYALPLAHVAEVSRPAYGAGDVPSSVVLRGREMRLLNLPAILGSQQPVKRIARVRIAGEDEVAVGVPDVVGTRWRLEHTLHPVAIEDPASIEAYAQKAVGLLRLVGPEHPEQNEHLKQETNPAPEPHSNSAQESSQ